MSGLADLESIAERIGHVEPRRARDRVVERHLAAGVPESLAERSEILGDQPGMRLARRRERLLHPHMELLRAGPEPAAAARGEGGRLR